MTYSKGFRLRMSRERDERFPVFLARLEAVRREMRTMSNLVITDYDYKSVVQENLMPEMLSMFHSLNIQQV